MPAARDASTALRGKRVAVVELERTPLYVVKVFSPDLRVSELL
jgi:hypothetical protein